MKLALDHLARNGDGTVRALDPDERWQLACVVGQAIRDGTYRPGRGRTRKEPKASGRGFRVLTIPDYVDKMVERAVVQVIQPLLDPLFLNTSLGYRPGMGRLDALALAEHLATTEERWVWIAEDLLTAFDLVPQQRLLDVIRHHLPDDRLVRLIETLVVTKPGKGLKQGGPLSALLLNLYLHHRVDRPWRVRCPGVPLVRVADDVLVLCNSEPEASEAYRVLAQLVADCGMKLKGTPASATRNLMTGDAVGWLGYETSLAGNQLQVGLSERAWKSLDRRLRDSHDKPDPTVRAQEVVIGWVGQLGPTHPSTDHRKAYERVTRIAADNGFEELPAFEELIGLWSDAHDRWERRRVSASSLIGVARGSARAEVYRAESGPLPGGAPERGVPPGTSLSNTYILNATGRCEVAGGPGTWAYALTADGRTMASRTGTSPHTTSERMAILGVLRGLEAVPAGGRVRVLDFDGRLAAGLAAVGRGAGDGVERAADGETPGGPAADLWRRLATEMAARGVELDGR